MDSAIAEILSLGGAIASIAGLLLGFFGGAPYWKKRGLQMAQEQRQSDGGGGSQYQRQDFGG